MTADISVRPATTEDHPAVRNVLDGANLQVGCDLRAAIERGAVLVATSPRGTVLGALVLDGPRIDAVAVRPGRRDRGIGRALVGAAGDRRERLVAECDESVVPFWTALGFDLEQCHTGRYRGVNAGRVDSPPDLHGD